MKESFTCYLDLTHINEELEEVEVECELELYKGSNTSDDPSEIEVISAKSLDEVRVHNFVLGEGVEIDLTQALEYRICDLYINHVSGS